MSTITLHRPVTTTRVAARPVRRPSAGVRLTRRGRLVVVGFALLVMLVLGVVWGSGSVATLHPGTPVPTKIVVVEPGDTLYDIAADVAPDGQVADMVEQLQQMNGLDDPMLQVGQHLRVPSQ